jgi:hypothetical protein
VQPEHKGQRGTKETPVLKEIPVHLDRKEIQVPIRLSLVLRVLMVHQVLQELILRYPAQKVHPAHRGRKASHISHHKLLRIQEELTVLSIRVG